MLHLVIVPYPGMGPSWCLRGPDWGMGRLSPPGWDLLTGPRHWLWADGRVCLSWLWGSPQDPKLRPITG